MAGWMTGFAICGGLACAFRGHSGVALGFSLGAALGILNYLWLHAAADAIVGAQDARAPVRVLLKFCLRYPMIFLIVYLCSRTGWLPLGAVLAGLLVQVAGLLTEAAFQLFQGGMPRREIV